jgi:hypothetical protein
VLKSVGSRWEIAPSYVLAASSFPLISSNFTRKVESMPFTFAEGRRIAPAIIDERIEVRSVARTG